MTATGISASITIDFRWPANGGRVSANQPISATSSAPNQRRHRRSAGVLGAKSMAGGDPLRRPSVEAYCAGGFSAGQPRDAAIGLAHQPGAARDGGGDEDLRPVALIVGTRGDARHPDEEREEPEHRGLEARRETRNDGEQHAG